MVSIAVGEGGPKAPPNEGFSDVQQLFAGIQQEGALLGAADAPVLVTVYNDLICISCGSYQVEEIEPVIERYARDGQVQFEYSHFSVGPQSITLGGLAATAAGEQGRQWQYIGLLVRNLDSAGGEADDDFLRDVAHTVPELEIELWESDRDSNEVREIVESDAASAVDLRLRPEPVVVVTGPTGETRLDDSPSSEEIEAAIEDVGG